MPTPYIKKLSAEGKGSIPFLENKWEEAKDEAEKQGHKNDWPYVTTIFKKMVNASLGVQFHSNVEVEFGASQTRCGSHFKSSGTL